MTRTQAKPPAADEELDDEDAGEERPRRQSRKAEKERRREEEQLCALRAGRAAYAEGRSLDELPPTIKPEHHDRYRWGWRRAEVEDTQGDGIPVYALFDGTLRDIIKLRQAHVAYQREGGLLYGGVQLRDDPRTTFPRLSGTMRDLRGSTWRHLFGGWEVVATVLPDTWGRPHLAKTKGGYFGDGTEMHPALESIGIWIDGGFRIELYVPVDGWQPSELIWWFAAEIAAAMEKADSFQQEADAIKRDPSRFSCASTNRRMYLNHVASYTKEANDARRRLYAYAEQHGIEVTPEMLNPVHLYGVPVVNKRTHDQDEPPQTTQLALML